MDERCMRRRLFGHLSHLRCKSGPNTDGSGLLDFAISVDCSCIINAKASMSFCFYTIQERQLEVIIAQPSYALAI
jgi:hypothetical protein